MTSLASDFPAALERDAAWKMDIGARPVNHGQVLFRAWAPSATRLQVKVLPSKSNPKTRFYDMTRDHQGYHSVLADSVYANDRYLYVLDGKLERPDPFSRFQPEGVHGPSAVINPDGFQWSDSAWRGLPHSKLIFYEAHVGAFTPEGTFQNAIRKLPYIKELGATCLEIMPVAQFPGQRNWGYDGVYLFAPQNSYGGPEGLKRLIDAAHGEGLAFCLDVVYNHLGPEGNYFCDFAPLSSQKYRTPWGDGINFDGPLSTPVREIFIANALYWICEYHIDVLRMDATDWILDSSPKHFLKELRERVKEAAGKLGREVSLVVEHDGNDSRIVNPERLCGYGIDAQWSDDFHHSVHSYLTGERQSYYQDFGDLGSIAKAVQETFVYQGQYSPFRKRKHGTRAMDIPGEKFVVCLQNHDQIGNRAFGERLSDQLSFEELKLAAALLLISPYISLIFMGQEYGEENPFQYFIDHGDEGLVQAVREGRQNEFSYLKGQKIPDPKSEQTFLNSKLDWTRASGEPHSFLFRLYKDLLSLKKSAFSLERARKEVCRTDYDEEKRWLTVRYQMNETEILALVVSFGEKAQILDHLKNQTIEILLDTEDPIYGGRGEKARASESGFHISPKSAAAVKVS